jgi:hypothetical protein
MPRSSEIFFLNLDDGLGLLQPAGEPVMIPAQLFILLDHGVSAAAAFSGL